MNTARHRGSTLARRRATGRGTARGRGERRVLDLLETYESPNVTCIDRAAGWPIVWSRARGVRVTDVAGRTYVDLTAAFGVAAAGHGNTAVVRAACRQAHRLLHAMGDVHPHALKAALCRELSRWTFERWSRGGAGVRGRTILANSGFEAVEAALKTALLATGRRRVVAFEGAYHGLGYGALNTTHRALFRRPFGPQLGRFGVFLPFPETAVELERVEGRLRQVFGGGDVGAVVVEPIQGRGGLRVPAPGLLSALRRLCDAHGALLIADEIFTGLGRTGRWFACEHHGVVPDLLCLGKALTGGFPLSACVGRADLMARAWPKSAGEAMHTSTFLGHPVGCAMALAQLEELRRGRLAAHSARLGRVLGEELGRILRPLRRIRGRVRGMGLMAGVELRLPDGEPASAVCLEAVRRMLDRGYLVLPEGAHGEVIAVTPPLVIGEATLRRAVRVLGRILVALDVQAG